MKQAAVRRFETGRFAQPPRWPRQLLCQRTKTLVRLKMTPDPQTGHLPGLHPKGTPVMSRPAGGCSCCWLGSPSPRVSTISQSLHMCGEWTLCAGCQVNNSNSNTTTNCCWFFFYSLAWNKEYGKNKDLIFWTCYCCIDVSATGVFQLGWDTLWEDGKLLHQQDLLLWRSPSSWKSESPLMFVFVFHRSFDRKSVYFIPVVCRRCWLAWPVTWLATMALFLS